jgi:hypothetical protein
MELGEPENEVLSEQTRYAIEAPYKMFVFAASRGTVKVS